MQYSLVGKVMADDKKIYSVSEVAQELGVSQQTVRRWLKEGYLKGVQVAKAGNWKVTRSELDRVKGDSSG